MRLLIDAQLPYKLCEILQDLGLEAIHVIELENGDESTDQEIIDYADKNEWIVLSKDVDFYHSHMTMKSPQRLFLVSTGNLKNRKLFDLFRNNILLIKKALETSDFVELNNTGIIEH
ncbi:MAG: hypothetical protein Tsb0034_20970 [Ekhidna sp.]